MNKAYENKNDPKALTNIIKNSLRNDIAKGIFFDHKRLSVPGKESKLNFLFVKYFIYRRMEKDRYSVKLLSLALKNLVLRNKNIIQHQRNNSKLDSSSVMDASNQSLPSLNSHYVYYSQK